MTKYEDLISPSAEGNPVEKEPEQTSKSGTALIVLYSIGIILILVSLIFRIPTVYASLNSMLASTSMNASTLALIILGIAIVFFVIAAVNETKLKKNNQITKKISKFLTAANVICWILVAISILLTFTNWFK